MGLLSDSNKKNMYTAGVMHELEDSGYFDGFSPTVR